MFIISTVAFAVGVVLASLVLLPRIAARVVPARFRRQELLFEAALVGFVLGVVVLAVEYIELAVRAFGESPYD
jgi:hypothetical protein